MSVAGVSLRNLVFVAVFAIAFAFVEASVVIYLRALYYPVGFSFPLRPIGAGHLGVELAREAATLVMLMAVAMIAAARPWKRFGFFCVAFGVWDIFFYFWLKVILGWPASLREWDILFLLPLPWIGPVAAPLAISVVLVVVGSLTVIRISAGRHFRPTLLSWALAVAGTAVLLYSFMRDTEASLYGTLPEPYRYGYLVAGLVLYLGAYAAAVRGRSHRDERG